MGRRAALAAAVAIAMVAGVACKGRTESVHRAGSAAAVEIGSAPTLGPDGGGGGGGGGAGRIGSGGATATTGPVSDEVEPNNTDDTATPISLGSTMRGRIEPDGDVDRYKIDIAKPGALAVMLSAVDGVDLVLELEDGDGNAIARSDRGGVRVREGVPNFGVTPGHYVAVVRAKKAPTKAAKPKPKHGKGHADADAAPAPPEPVATGNAPVYELSVTENVSGGPGAAADGIEHEPDDDRGTANDLIVGDTGTGFIGWTGDVDVWKLSVEALSAKNALDVEISAVDGVALVLDIADGVGQPLLTRKAPRGAPLTVRGLVPLLPAGAPPFHYLTVKGDRSNPETAYQLHVTAHLIGPDDEIEPNDSPDHPQQVPADRTVVHATWTPGDVDCFALAPADVPHGVTITIDASGDVDLSADLRVGGAVVAHSAHPGRGAAESVSATIPPHAIAVACVRGADASATTGGGYDFVIKDGDDHGDGAAPP